MMECPNCKMSIKGSSTFCIHCGAQLSGLGAQANTGSLPNNTQGMGTMPPAQNNGMQGPPLPPIQGGTPQANSAQPVPSGTAQANNTQAMQNNLQPMVNNTKHEDDIPVTYKSRILITLSALGILIVYSYMIFTLSVLIYTAIKLYSSPLYAQYVTKSIFASKEFLMILGVDLVLIVSFVLTVLHKKFMGFAAMLYSVGFIIYDFAKLDKAVMPIVASVFVIICAIFYISEEDPV